MTVKTVLNVAFDKSCIRQMTFKVIGNQSLKNVPGGTDVLGK